MVDIEIARIFGYGAAMGDHDGFLPKQLVSALFVGPDDQWLATFCAIDPPARVFYHKRYRMRFGTTFER